MILRDQLVPVEVLRPEDSDPDDDPACAGSEFVVNETGSLVEVRWEGSY